jgi:hypothetical protein
MTSHRMQQGCVNCEYNFRTPIKLVTLACPEMYIFTATARYNTFTFLELVFTCANVFYIDCLKKLLVLK